MSYLSLHPPHPPTPLSLSWLAAAPVSHHIASSQLNTQKTCLLILLSKKFVLKHRCNLLYQQHATVYNRNVVTFVSLAAHTQELERAGVLVAGFCKLSSTARAFWTHTGPTAVTAAYQRIAMVTFLAPMDSIITWILKGCHDACHSIVMIIRL